MGRSTHSWRPSLWRLHSRAASKDSRPPWAGSTRDVAKGKKTEQEQAPASPPGSRKTGPGRKCLSKSWSLNSPGLREGLAGGISRPEGTASTKAWESCSPNGSPGSARSHLGHFQGITDNLWAWAHTCPGLCSVCVQGEHDVVNGQRCPDDLPSGSRPWASGRHWQWVVEKNWNAFSWVCTPNNFYFFIFYFWLIIVTQQGNRGMAEHLPNHPEHNLVRRSALGPDTRLEGISAEPLYGRWYMIP